LFITTLQPLGLAFFNYINKLLTIQCFESFSPSFYLLFFSYMLYNSKWSKIFQACNQHALKNEFKELPSFWTFFLYKCDLVKCNYLDFYKALKRIIVNSNTNILQSTQWKFLKFFPHLLKPVFLKDPMITCVQKFGACTGNGSFGEFWWKHSLKPLKVNALKLSEE